MSFASFAKSPNDGGVAKALLPHRVSNDGQLFRNRIREGLSALNNNL